ncbi:MAG: hypothetical protein ILA02_05110 [Clostridia bacterium]|nr:hypothetical protein [Clostridia bacterium]
MMKKFFTKNGRNFVVGFDSEKKEVFVGTAGLISQLAAQVISHDLMAPLKWKSKGTVMDLVDKNGLICPAVGYKIPFWVSTKRAEAMVASLFD